MSNYTERYEQRKKVSEGGSQTTYRDRYRERSGAGSRDELQREFYDRVSAFETNARELHEGYLRRDPMKTGTGEMLTDTLSRKASLDTEAAWIRSFMDSPHTAGLIDGGQADSVKRMVDGWTGIADSVWRAAEYDDKPWIGYGSEEAYKEYLDWKQGRDKMLDEDPEAIKAEIDRLREEQAPYENAHKKTSGLTGVFVNAYDKLAALASEMTGGAVNDSTSEFRQRAAGKYGEYESRIADRNVYLRQVQALQKTAALEAVADASSAGYDAEFERYARLGRAHKNPTVREAESGRGGAVNKATYAKDNADGIGIGEANGGGSDVVRFIHTLMTDREVDIYSYYFGRGEYEKADEYLESLEETLTARHGMGIAERVSDKPVVPYLYGVGAGFEQFSDGMRGLFSDEYRAPSATQIASGLVRESLADEGPKIGGASVWQGVYDLLSTTANMLPSILASYAIGTVNPVAGTVVGSGLMGTSAAGNAKAEMLSLGYDKDQANAYGLLVGSSEALLQSTLGGITKLGGALPNGVTEAILTKVDNALARAAITLGGEMISEGAEEGLQTILEPWFKEVVTGADFAAADIDEVLYSTLLGALSAGFLDGADMVIGTVGQNRQTKAAFGDLEAEFVASGMESAEGTLSRRLAERYGKKLENGGHLTGAQISRLTSANEEAIREEDIRTMSEAVSGRLAALGEPGDTAALAGVIAAKAAGQRLSRAEQSIIDGSRFGRQVLSEPAAENPYDRAKSNGTNSVNSDAYNADLMRVAEEASGVGTDAAEEAAGGAESVSTANNATEEEKAAEGAYEATEGTDDGSATEPSVSAQEDTEALLSDMVTSMKVDGQTAAALRKGYDKASGVSASLYAMDMPLAYEYGKINYKAGLSRLDIPFEQASLGFVLGRSAAEAEAKRATAKAETRKPAAKGTGKVHFEGGTAAKTFTERQKASVKGLERLARALGVDIYLYESARGEDGRLRGANGWYNQNDGSIHIDILAGNDGQGTMLFTAAHELTHFIKAWSPEKFKVLSDFLIEQYGARGVEVDGLIEAQIDKAKRNGRTLTRDEAFEEVVADSMETMLSDGELIAKIEKLRQKDAGIVEKIKEFLTKLAARIKAAYDGMNPDSMEGQYVADMLDAVERLRDLWTEGLMEASERRGRMMEDEAIEESATNDEEMLGTGMKEAPAPGKEGTVTNGQGDPVAHSTEDGTIRLSLRTYEDGGREALRGYLQKCANQKRITETEMDEMIAGIEDIYGVCREFKDQYAPFGTWSEAEVVRDTRGKPVFSVVTPNGDYKMNLDFSLVCKKRRTLDAVFNEMCRRGIMDDFELGQKSVVKINEIIRRYGLETACALCFVDAKRFRQASMADQFVSLYNGLVQSLVPEADRGRIDRFNFAGDKTVNRLPGGIHTWGNTDLDFSHLDEVMKNYEPGTVEYKAAKYIKSHAEGRRLLSRGDFMSSKGFDAVKTRNKDVLSLYNSKKGTGGPKAAFGDVQYMNEIIAKARHWTPEKAYAVGGVRVQSFSDYVPRMVFDYVQMVYDLVATRLPAHAYTKEAAFVKQFGLTGMKINMSLIPAVVKGGVAPGLDADGGYAWAGESFNYDTAVEIQNADGYTENCGTVCVGVSDKHILKLLDDPNIRMVIPYHKSGLNPIVAHMNRVAAFTDYTDSQNTKDANGKKVDKEFDFNRVLHDMGEEADPKAVADRYIKWCASHGYTPKFSRFAEHESYYKLLADFTLFDKDGVYVPQREVRALFPKEGSAFGSMKELIREGLEEDAIVEGKRDRRLSAIVDEIEREIPRTDAEIEEIEVKQAEGDLEEIRYSLRDVDPVIPSSGKWERSATTDEVRMAHPTLYAVDEFVTEERNPTQVKGTVGTYRKIYSFLKQEGFTGTILDASSGLGLGTQAGIEEFEFDVDDIEPYPDKKYKPKYTDYSSLNRKYDVIISNAVLNVLPQDQRDALVVKMGEMLKDGGRIFINVRGNDVLNAAGKIAINESCMEYFIPRTTKTGSYQKGFTKDELKAYLEDALGEDFYVEKTNLFGGVAVIVTKRDNLQYSDRDTESVSNRALLAGALETVARSDNERKRLAEYKQNIERMDAEQARLSELRAQINELSFANGERDTERIKALRDDATKTANRINTYDKRLLRLESTNVLKNVLDRERKKAYDKAKARGKEALDEYRKKAKARGKEALDEYRKKAKARGKEALDEYRKKAKERQREIIARNAESRKRAAEGRHNTEMRHKILSVVEDLNRLLLNPTKERHIPIGLQKPVAEALSAINMDTVEADKQLARLDARIAAETDEEKRLDLLKRRERVSEMGESLKDKLERMRGAYAAIRNSDDPMIKNTYDENIEGMIGGVLETVGDTSIRSMNGEQLKAVYDLYKAVLKTVRDANRLFLAGKAERVSDYSEAALAEMTEVGRSSLSHITELASLRDFGWNMLKPIYAMRMIGSGTLTELYRNVRLGEDIWANDVQEARDFFRATADKYGYEDWDMDTLYAFKDGSGNEFELTLSHILSLYAYSKRDKADLHLSEGGILTEDCVKPISDKWTGKFLHYDVDYKHPIRLDKDIVSGIVATLTAEHRGFVDEMQTYLSDVMGAKGNEVSLAMYDIKLFGETNYFPLMTAKYFLEFKPENNGDPKIKNKGFTKSTKPNAQNPIVLSGFMDVWANHINDMAMYHGFVLPMEDLTRVFNYSTKTDADGYSSVRMKITSIYGKQACACIESLMRDLNGGARIDSTVGFLNKATSLAKKASTFASLSVAIQQPTSVIRAMAVIDPKYFAGKPDMTRHRETWEEVKRYAPVAKIKEMGYFDTGIGRSTVDFIKSTEYDGMRKKLGALFTDKNFRDEVLSRAPSLLDELTWCGIWKAVKREVAATTDLAVSSEAYMKRVGERFTEVIELTQVYDSVLSRSALMRSRDTGMKMATAFMAEPTVNLDMLIDAAVQGKRAFKHSKKAAAKATLAPASAVVGSIVLNSVAKAVVLAMRDDDEDENLTEKYIEALSGDLVDNLNPFMMVPLLRDIVSVFSGYDVSRMDMTVFSDLAKAIDGLGSKTKTEYQKISHLVTALSALFGLPLRNVERDIRGIHSTVKTILRAKDQPTTAASALEAHKEGITGKKTAKELQLYEAMLGGDETQIRRVKARFKGEKDIEKALRKGLRENDPRIKEAAEARYRGDIAGYMGIAKEIIGEGHFSQDTVVGAVNAEVNEIKTDESGGYDPEDSEETTVVTSIYQASDIHAAFESGDRDTALAVIDELISIKTENNLERARMKAEKNGTRFNERVARREAEDKARSSLRAYMTAYWKDRYKEAYRTRNTAECERIKKILKDSGLYGSASDVMKACREWRREDR